MPPSIDFQCTHAFHGSPGLRHACLALCAALSTASAPGIAGAQDQPTAPAERVTITGSNIPRSERESASPLTVITRRDIDRSGFATVSDLVLGLAQAGSGSVPAAFGAGFAQGGAGVSLRGLGVNATLVLVNGRRMASYALTDDGQRSFVDLDALPLDAVERVEVLRDSGSAVYGSDAIAGVVNIILRSDFAGRAFGATAGGALAGQGRTGRLTASYGHGDRASDGYTLFGFFEASHAGAIANTARSGPVATDNLQAYGGPDNRSGWIDAGAGVALPSLVGNVQPRQPDGSNLAGAPGYTSLPGCAAANSPAVVAPALGQGGCWWSPGTLGQIAPRIDRVNFYGGGGLDVSSALHARLEFGLFRDVNVVQLAPVAIDGSVFNPTTFAVSLFDPLLPPGHPDNPFGAQGQAAQVRFAAAAEPFTAQNVSTTLRVLAGLSGRAAGWDFDGALLYSRNTVVQYVHGLVSRSGLLAHLADGGLRIGQNFGLSTPQALADVYPELRRPGVSEMRYVDLRANRELGHLPGGALQLALGTELRVESQWLNGDFPERAGDIMLPGFSGFTAERRVQAAYGELTAPLTQQIEASAALRTDRYSDSGTSTTPKLGLKWTASPLLTLRGTYAGGFRAPGPSENGQSSTVLFLPYVDPLRCPVTQLPLDCGAGITDVVATGNAAIRPETSHAYSLGVILQPAARMNATLDYYAITRRNEITPPDFLAVLANPAGTPGGAVLRDNSATPGLPGPVLAITAPYANAASSSTTGIDLQLDAAMTATPEGRLRGRLDLTYIITFRRQQAGGSTLDYAGTHGPYVFSNMGTPRTRATLVLDWDRGPWALSTRLAYTDGIRSIADQQHTQCLALDSSGGPSQGACRVASFTSADLVARRTLREGLEATVSVGNVFDRRAPLDAVGGGHNYNLMDQAGAVGRTLAVGLRWHGD